MINQIFFKELFGAWKPYFKVCLYGALLALAFPPFKFGFIAYLGLIPFLYWSKIDKKSDAFKTGYWWGFGFHTAGLYWIINSTVLGGVLTLLYLPLYSAVTLLLCRFFFQRFGRPGLLWLFPFLWTAMEYIRTVGVLGFPWMSVAYSQTYYPALIQYSDYTGVHGVVFWICVLNVFVFLIVEQIRSCINEGRSFINAKSALLIIVPVFLIAVPIIHGSLSIRSGSYMGDSIKVSLIQGHVDMDQKTDAEFTRANFKNYETLSLKAAETKPDLIVWPETATATWLRYRMIYRRLWIMLCSTMENITRLIPHCL
jgi:apolipoprotein N-acyltransferase